MQINRQLVGLGLFLITIGGVMVAVRQGVLSEESARHAWNLWPLILVGVGLSIVLAGRPGAALGGLVLAVTFGAMLGGVAATGVFPGVGVCTSAGDAGSRFADTGGNLGPNARASIAQDCGNLAVGTVAGSTWSVSGSSRDGRAPSVDQSATSLRVENRDDGPFDLGGSSDWSVVLPRDTTLDLDLTVNGGQSRANLDGAHLGTLEIDANAGSIDLDLRQVVAIDRATIDLNFGSATVRLPNLDLAADLSVNAGSAAICLPPGTGLRVTLKSVAASNDFASHGLIESNGTWQTPGFATAAVRIDLRADVNAGSLTLDPARTCAG